MKRIVLLLCIGMLCVSPVVMAQQKTVSGTVTAAEDQSVLAGVTVRVKETSATTSTDDSGQYSVAVETGQTLVFTYIGTQPVERVVGQGTVIDVSLASNNPLDEVVVVGYGTQQRSNLTGAVATIDVEKTIGQRPVTDLARGLQGASPGLTITTASGDLGRDANIRLRGMTGSLNAGGAKPLILLDNVEIQSLQLINPDDVESISVLKDAASTSIYGTRGAWGVILITTKSGKKGAPNRISYSNNLAWQTPTQTPEIAGGVEGTEMILEALRRTANNPDISQFSMLGMSFDDIGLQKIRDWVAEYGDGSGLSDEMVMGRDFEIRDNKLFFYRPWDVNERYMKTWTPQQRHNLSFSGGGEKTSYNLGLGYQGQDGVLKVKPDKFDRYNLSLGVNSSINDWIDARGKVIFSNTVTEVPFTFSAATYGPWYYLYRWPAVYPYGTYEGNSFRSALTETEQAHMDSDKKQYTRVSAGVTLRPVSDLTIDFDYTYSSMNQHIRSVGGGTSGIDFWAGTLNYLENYQSASYDRVQYNSNWDEINTGKLFLTYGKAVGNHDFKVLAGGDLELFQFNGQMSHRKEMFDPELGEISLATGEQLVGGHRRHWSTLGFFGRINYAFKNKFLLELNGRYDGSSRFPLNQKWGFFPSMSAGYVLTQEEFMQPISNALSFLKVRASWGSVGNQDVVRSGNSNVVLYPFIPIMDTQNSGWWIGDENKLTIGTPAPVSSSLTWETVTTLDIGLDARFINNSLGLTFDWYDRTTSNMLSPGVTLPASFGAATPRRNYGELQTRGWELAIDWSHQFDNGLQLNAMGMLSDFKETITKFANTTENVHSNYEGKVLGEIWGLRTDRIFTPDDFSGQNELGRWILKDGIATQGPLISAEDAAWSWFQYGPGDIKYTDLNGDGVIDYGSSTLDDHGDLEVIGNSTPRWQYGFRLGAAWKGFDFDAFIQGVGKRDFWASGPIFIPGYRTEAFYAHQTDYWTPENPDAFYPRIAQTNQRNDAFNFRQQSRYLLDLSYLRMKNITLGYSLPQGLLSQIKVNQIRVYLSGENLFEFSDVGMPIDPEIDYTPEQSDLTSFGRVYPYRRTLSFGIQVTL